MQDVGAHLAVASLFEQVGGQLVAFKCLCQLSQFFHGGGLVGDGNRLAVGITGFLEEDVGTCRSLQRAFGIFHLQQGDREVIVHFSGHQSIAGICVYLAGVFIQDDSFCIVIGVVCSRSLFGKFLSGGVGIVHEV